MTFSISAKIQDGSQNLVLKINAFCTEIQDGRQKWQESDFCEKFPVDSADNLQVRNFVEITISNGFPDKCVLHFPQKFKMATKKWRESDFCKKSPVHSADTLRVQNFVEISLSHTISEINVLLRFTQTFKNCRQKWWEIDFCLKSPVESSYALWAKNFTEIALSHTVSEISVVAFYTEIQDGCQK